jgi:hypothetical protein
MIRKPPENWQTGDIAAVRSVRAAAGVAKGGVRMARRGGHVARGVFCYFFAGLWGFAALAGGLAAGSLPSLIGIGAMAGFMFWAGRRAFAKARDVSAS